MSPLLGPGHNSSRGPSEGWWALRTAIWLMTYGAETWTLTARLVHKFKVAHRAMERDMLEVSLRDRIRNQVIRQITKLTVLACWSGSGLAISAVEPITAGLNVFWSGDGKRSVGRPQARWSDDLRRTAGRSWERVAEAIERDGETLERPMSSSGL
jgi:hypothetical protein